MKVDIGDIVYQYKKRQGKVVGIISNNFVYKVLFNEVECIDVDRLEKSKSNSMQKFHQSDLCCSLIHSGLNYCSSMQNILKNL